MSDIRPARTDEIAEILELWSTSAAEPGVADTRPAVLALMERDVESLLVAQDDGEIVGAIIAAWDGWRGSIYRLAVKEDSRRRGIASELVHEAERVLRLRGARRIQAMVYANEPAARAFWEALGYGLDDRLVRYVKDAN